MVGADPGPGDPVTKILITGVTGQDGSYLAELLAKDPDNDLYGMVRGENNPKEDLIRRLVPTLNIVHGDLTDTTSIVSLIKDLEPEVIYNLGGLTSPAVGWTQPLHMSNVTGLGVVRLLEAVRLFVPEAKVLQACSIARHGIYGAAKNFARSVAVDYRSRGMHVTNLIMGGHHSPRRGATFFSQKVVKGAVAIYQNKQWALELGFLGRSQDWGDASNFASMFPAILDLAPDDYVLSTGTPFTCQEWVETVFRILGIHNWQKRVRINPGLNQPTDVSTLTATPDHRLPWRHSTPLHQLAEWMVHSELAGDQWS